MRTDELSRALHTQADEAAATAPVFRLNKLVARRARARRRIAVGGAVVATLAAVVTVAALSGDPVVRRGGQPVAGPSETPSVSASPTPRATSDPSPTPTSGDGAAWRTVECPVAGRSDCDIPATLTFRGRTWTRSGGGSQPVHWHNGVNREIALSVVPIGAPQLVLVGATRAGPRSRLSVSVNWARSEPTVAGSLTPVLLEVTPDSQHVTVREDGTAPRNEVLRIVTYRPAR